MARLEVTCDDFSLVFTASKYKDAWERAEKRIAPDHLTSIYEVEGADSDIRLFPDNGAEVSLRDNPRAFFFDNVDYDVWLEMVGSGCMSPAVLDDSSAIGNAFTRHGRVLTGQLNFGNDIGRADFRFRYEKAGAAREVVLTFEVLSSKLDYHKDWEQILNDVERKYPMLAADYLKRTYHAFDRTPNADAQTPDLMWWSLFRQEQEPFLKACWLIVRRPRRKLVPEVEYRRADRLLRLTPALENEYAECKHTPSHLYRVEREDMSHDTVENRFVKYAIGFVLHHHRKIRGKIEKSYGEKLSEEAKTEILCAENELKRLLTHPFFRDVGRFKGLRQESSVLQRAPGYSTVWKTFGVLNASYLLYQGVRRLQTKNIADLYEIWCFVKLEEIVRACCDEVYGPVSVEDKYQILDEKFVQQLDEGEDSSVIFSRDGVELAKLVYNLRFPFEGIKEGAGKISTPTSLGEREEQKPDIVLRLTKSLDGDDFRLTYLFDAKYRLGNRDGNGIDYPLQENLDQMHRYRDAIYYGAATARDGSHPNAGKAGEPRPDASAASKWGERFKREVVGGYVLFPGDGVIPSKPEDDNPDERPRFIKSIDNVNIGAFPLRPGSDETLLKEFIGQLLAKDAESEILETIPHKGTELQLEATGAAIAKHIVFFLSSGRNERRHGYKRGFTKAVGKTGICPVPEDFCNDPAGIKMIVFPSVSGAETFMVKDGGTPAVKRADFITDNPQFMDALRKANQPKKKGDPPPPDEDLLPAPEYWVFPVEGGAKSD